MHQNAFGGRALPEPSGELTALPDPIAGFKGPYFQGKEMGMRPILHPDLGDRIKPL